MKNNNSEFTDILHVEGVLSEGDGIIPQMVMRDSKLTMQARLIYAYIASFAGTGVDKIPNDLICKELDLSKYSFYKHLDQLKKYNYIKD